MVDFRTDRETDTDKDIMFDNVSVIEKRAQGMKGAVKGMGINWTVVLRDQICDILSFSFRDGDGLSEKKIEIRKTKENTRNK